MDSRGCHNQVGAKKTVKECHHHHSNSIVAMNKSDLLYRDSFLAHSFLIPNSKSYKMESEM